MIFNANARKSRTQWAKELKDTQHKTFTHPTGCKRGHEKLFSVSEGGKCVECVRLKDRKKYAKQLGISLEELEQKRVNEHHQQVQRQLEKAEGQLQRRIWRAEAKAQPTYAHVYALTCTETDRTYIGSTQNLPTRMAQHISHINHGTHPSLTYWLTLRLTDGTR